MAGERGGDVSILEGSRFVRRLELDIIDQDGRRRDANINSLDTHALRQSDHRCKFIAQVSIGICRKNRLVDDRTVSLSLKFTSCHISMLVFQEPVFAFT